MLYWHIFLKMVQLSLPTKIILSRTNGDTWLSVPQCKYHVNRQRPETHCMLSADAFSSSTECVQCVSGQKDGSLLQFSVHYNDNTFAQYCLLIDLICRAAYLTMHRIIHHLETINKDYLQVSGNTFYPQHFKAFAICHI